MFQALTGKVVVDVLDDKNITESGVIVCKLGKEYPVRGQVVSVGRDRKANGKTYRAPCKKGDIVHYKKNASRVISTRWESKRRAVVYFGDVVGVERDGKLLATNDNVIVQVFFKDTSDIIYIPETIKKKSASFFGYVHAIGPDFEGELKVGDKVAFPRDEGFYILFKEQAYHSLYPRHVRGKLECDLMDLR